MGLTVRVVGAGVLGLALSMQGVYGAISQAQTPAVPDAPKPQTLPQLNTITPPAPAIPNAPTPKVAPADTGATNGGVVPASSLPSSVASSAAGTNDAATANDAAVPQSPAPSTALSTGPGGGDPVQRHRSDIRVFTNFVEVPFTVKDSKGVLVPGLTPRDVRVYENGLQQQIRLFTVDPSPLSVAVVIDQSVTFDTMDKVNASLDSLQAAFTPYDEMAVYTYNNGVKEQTGFTGAQSQRVAYALQRSRGKGREQTMALTGPLAQTTVKNDQAVDPNLNGNNNPTLQANIAPPREYHTLNDAILQAAIPLARAGKGRRRVIFVISDGKEYGSQAKEKEVIQFLQRNQIAVYATLVGDTSVPGMEFLDKFHIPLQMKDNVLPRYATATGGDYNGAFRPRAIENSFARLSEESRTQYVAGYYSHEPFIDGKFRPVEVRVLRPALDVIAKKGYYPNATDAVDGGPASGGTATPAPAAPSSAPTTR